MEEDFEWKLEIRRENNGYTLKGKFGDTDMVSVVVIEDEEDELASHEKLLWEVVEYFNFSGSKHDKERIRVVREKGDIESQEDLIQTGIDNHLEEGGK